MSILCMYCGIAYPLDDSACAHCHAVPARSDGVTSLLRGSVTEGYFNDSHERLYAIEESHFWFAYRNRLINDAMRRFLPHAVNFLEIGCGNGIVLQSLQQTARLTLSAGDYYRVPLINVQKRLKDVTLYQCDVLDMPFADEFDAIGAFDVIEHLEDDARAFGELYKALISGGALLLTVPQHPWLWSRSDEQAKHKRRYTRSELAGKLEKAGFEITYITSFMSFLLPLLLVSRWIKKHKHSAPDAWVLKNELCLPRPINAMLDGVCTLEGACLRYGMHLPVGGSLLCVAVKTKRGS